MNTQDHGISITLFSCLGFGAFGKGKNVSENSDQSNLVDIQR